jgi:hypothetical protein
VHFVEFVEDEMPVVVFYVGAMCECSRHVLGDDSVDCFSPLMFTLCHCLAYGPRHYLMLSAYDGMKDWWNHLIYLEKVRLFDAIRQSRVDFVAQCPVACTMYSD